MCADVHDYSIVLKAFRSGGSRGREQGAAAQRERARPYSETGETARYYASK